ncbi:fatty acid elongase [Rhodotorula toruloides]|uniref:Elongation of fatty acids protein n=1 Tax=Rhodotorula toruloides TaxID=5286 RepID=A0A511KLC2_RHOTO|nr:fatty acid elongase [Rhodotorula toruloides]
MTSYAAQPRASSFLASFADGPKPPTPTGIPGPLASTYDLFLNPVTPLAFGLVYFATAKTLSHFQNGKNRIKGKGWDVAVLVHNILLAVYSAWTFLGTAPQIFGAFVRGYMADGFAGLTHAFCDSSFAIWQQTTFPKFAYLFYVSKFYEIVDTAILLLKGKKVGMLQSYHHMGAIWTMYAAYATQAMPVWLFVVFNSFIHSIMYTYYAFSTVSLPFPRFLKKSLTRLQITQFLVGGSLAASYLFIKLPDLPSAGEMSAAASSSFEAGVGALKREGPTCLVNAAQRHATLLNCAYLVPLTYLFVAFFFKTYKKNSAANAAAKAKAQAKKAN